MTDHRPAHRTLSRWIIAIAFVPLVLSVTLSGFATFWPQPEAPTASPSSAPWPFLGSASLDDLLNSRGGDGLLLLRTASPAPIASPVPTASPAPVVPPYLSVRQLEAYLGIVLPADQIGSLPEVFTADDTVFYVKSDTLSLRDGPATKYTVVHKLTYAEKVTRTGYGASWSRVVTTDGKAGYVATQYLVRTKPAPKISAADLLRAKVVAVAKAQLGVPYVHYAASPTAGFDCSGLVWYAYRLNGIAVPRSAAAYATFGKRVTRSQLKPGDVLCWDTYKDGITKLNHVTMYVGNGIMIEAPGGGKVVRYSVLEGYYATLLDIRRIIQ